MFDFRRITYFVWKNASQTTKWPYFLKIWGFMASLAPLATHMFRSRNTALQIWQLVSRGFLGHWDEFSCYAILVLSWPVRRPLMLACPLLASVWRPPGIGKGRLDIRFLFFTQHISAIMNKIANFKRCIFTSKTVRNLPLKENRTISLLRGLLGWFVWIPIV